MRVTQIQPDAMTMAGRHTLVETNTPQILYEVQGTSSTAPDFPGAINSGVIQASNTWASRTFTPKSLRFKLSTIAEALGSQPGAPIVLHPVFASNQGWTLEATDS